MARQYSEVAWGDDPLLLSVPGMGPLTAPTVRAYLLDATQFPSAKEAQAFAGLNPSNWSSGMMETPSHSITKETCTVAPGLLSSGQRGLDD